MLVPSNEAMERVDQQRLDYILGDSYLRTEMFGLHLTRERITSTQYKITASNDAVRLFRLDSFSKTFLPTTLTSLFQTYSSPASYAANRVWFHNNQDYSRGRAGATNTMSVWGRGVNASASETVRPLRTYTSAVLGSLQIRALRDNIFGEVMAFTKTN